MADLTGIGSVADLANTVIGKIWPDKTEAEKQQLAAAVSLVQGQLEVNKVEAGSSSVFVAGWRPFIGWVCGAALAYQYLLRPILTAALPMVGYAPPVLISLDDNLWELLFGMLGMGGLRTFEKVKGVAR